MDWMTAGAGRKQTGVVAARERDSRRPLGALSAIDLRPSGADDKRA